MPYGFIKMLSKEILSGHIRQDSVVGMTLNDAGEIEFLSLDDVKI